MRMTQIYERLKINITPMESKTDEAITFQIYTNEPSHQIVIKASTKDDRQETFISEATYISDNNGLIDLNLHSPVEGDYKGIDVLGLFWSMRSKKNRMFIKHSPDPLVINIKIYDNDELLASEQVTRTFYQKNIVKKVLNDDAMIGTLSISKMAIHYLLLLFWVDQMREYTNPLLRCLRVKDTLC